MWRQMLAGEILDPADFRSCPRQRRNHGHDPLTLIGVRNADHSDLLDRRVALQHGLDLTGADLEPARLDDVDRAAADDAILAIGLAHGEVAGTEKSPLAPLFQ